jgi:hypothetical protein
LCLSTMPCYKVGNIITFKIMANGQSDTFILA